VVERGAIELECRSGGRAPFSRGDVVHLTGLPLRALRNRGPDLAVLTVVRRRVAPTRRRAS
jgi:hypothetical protein